MSYINQFLDEEVTIEYLDIKSKEIICVKGKLVEVEKNGMTITLLNNKSLKRIFVPLIKEITIGEKEL